MGLGLAAIFLCLADARPLAAEDDSRSGALPSSDGSSPSSPGALSFLITSSLDLLTGEVVIRESHPGRAAEPQEAQQQQKPTIIERIDFVGNRRVRNDTLKARIFSREGDPYNEETLRRDFQALWNTQFFEDVKLRVEDSPDGPNHKNIIFDVKERPVIRRIRYDGIHSVSESDILDRFKERKVGLTGGHIFQGECLPDYMWANRLSARTPMQGVYLCGACTHPGGSVIGINGRNAAMAVLKDLGRI